jgi:hypothetical protein
MEYKTYYSPEGKENKAKPSSEYYMGYLYVSGKVQAVLAGLCHSGVRSVEYHMWGKNFYPSSNGQLCGVP